MIGRETSVNRVFATVLFRARTVRWFMQNVSSGEASPVVPHTRTPEMLSGIGVYPGPPAHHPYRPLPDFHVERPQFVPGVMSARPRELLGALALVIAADVALWRGGDIGAGGTGLAIFFVAVPALVVLAARARRLTLRLLATILLLLAVAARCAYEPTPGSVVLGVLGVFALAITLRSRAAFLTDVAASFGATFATIPMRFVAAVRGLRTTLVGGGAGRQGRSFAPLAIPFALVSLFVAIFGLANPLVGRWLLAATGSVAVPPAVRMLSWAVLLPCAVLLLRPAVWRSKKSEAAEMTGVAATSSLDIARNALAALNVLFLAYNALDAKYLWAGSAPPGVTERAYAHEGAAWLTVAIAVLTVVVGVMFRGALAHDARARLLRTLAFVWLGQGVVLALGTYRRLFIHIGTSGLSSLRILGMVGTTLVVVGLLQVGLKLWRGRSLAWLLRRQLDAVVLGLLGFSLLPAHLISAPINVRHVMAHDYQALVNIEEEAREPESAAALLPMLGHDDERIRRGVAALLLNERDELRSRAARGGLRDRELATTRALAALEAASPELDAVLGDVPRAHAITPFEYIRNSSIEGDIAQSEINKVEYASTRSEIVVKRWLDASFTGFYGSEDIFAPRVVVDGVSQERSELIEAKARMPAGGERSPETSFVITPTADADRLVATAHVARSLRPGVKTTDTVLVLAREPGSQQWHVVEERTTHR